MAYAMFRELGYAQLTTDAVAARCHISKRTLYRLFPNKGALVAAIIDTHRRQLIALPGDYDDLSPIEALERIFVNEVEDEHDRERFAFLKLLFIEAAQNPELDQIVRLHGRDVALGLLEDWIAREVELGRLRVPDAHGAARMLMDLVAGATMPARTGPVEWPGSAARRAYVSECIRLFVNGAAPRH
ncbi:TetR/AcrR family transcriptional regulator [Ancylobacter mangrovi]|uniref:TetR/AcrR family transcriptional regulator n=1 Tax=Ancylobacter mangrovi TaxID=2972472 RepID=A0A9X2PDV1_9HYPH|nr:TetR/AcrR family transcriptional regulator [Ancylobacter mangrovi]MCS0493757.1 TetR/AcrR family transcriptional regulator [Ancylobacter mangrovi]MCS0501546.1 TetR/AcrR family transcriptional regulator [Ancylobacter mangrovi]